MRAHLALISRIEEISPILAFMSLQPWESISTGIEGFAIEEDGNGRSLRHTDSPHPMLRTSFDGEKITFHRGEAGLSPELHCIMAAIGLCRGSAGSAKYGELDVENFHNRLSSIDHVWLLIRALRNSRVPQARVMPFCEALLRGALEWSALRLKQFECDSDPRIEAEVDRFTTNARATSFGVPGAELAKLHPDPRGSSISISLPGRDYPFDLSGLILDWPTGPLDPTDVVASKPARDRYGVIPTKLPDAVIGVLNTIQIDGANVRIVQRLAKPLYEKVNQVLIALGGRWHTGSQAHVFGEDPWPLITDAISREAVFTDRDYEFFATQPREVERMILEAGLEPGMDVLEPNAGEGALAMAAAEIVGKARFTCFELMPRNVKALQAMGFKLDGPSDFLHQEPSPVFDVVLLNPPFSGGRDIAHIRHALKFVKPGGRLVAIASTSWRTLSTKSSTEFRSILDALGARVQDIERGAFRDAGTDVATSLITIRSPLAAFKGYQQERLSMRAAAEQRGPSTGRTVRFVLSLANFNRETEMGHLRMAHF